MPLVSCRAEASGQVALLPPSLQPGTGRRTVDRGVGLRSLGHCQALQRQGRNADRGGLLWRSQHWEAWYEVWWEGSLSNVCSHPCFGLGGRATEKDLVSSSRAGGSRAALPVGTGRLARGLGWLEKENTLLRAELEATVTLLPRL